jgi:hypothetical protein
VYQRHKPPQEIGAMGHPAFVAGTKLSGQLCHITGKLARDSPRTTLTAKAALNDAWILSVSSLVCKLLHFSQQTGLHVENEASHGDVFGNPGMRSDLLDLLLGIFLRVLKGEEAHWSRRSISG